LGLDVVGLGMSFVDYNTRIPRIPRFEEGVSVLEFDKQGGGAISTGLVTLAKLGAKVGYIGKIGDDEHGKFILDEYRKYGVDISHVVVERGKTSPFVFVLVDAKTGKRAFIVHRGSATQPLKPNEIDRDYIRNSSMVFMEGFRAYEALIEVAKTAREVGITVLIDGSSPEIVKVSNIVIAGERDAYASTGTRKPGEAVEKLLSLGPEIAVITLGKRGCLCKTREKTIRKPSFKVDVVDTTGAGDVFHGAFAYGLLQSWELENVVEFASAVAAIKCTKLGGRAGIPTFPEAQRFLRDHGSPFF